MKVPARRVAGLLPLLLLAGCFHFHKTNQDQVQTLAPPIEDTPPPKPVPSPTDLPPPVVTLPVETPPPQPAPQPEAKPKPPVKRKKPVAAPPPTTATTQQQASNGTPGVSAIGQLSSGEPSDQRQQTLNSIAATEHGLKEITRELSDPEKKTAEHIREFLKQAKTALNSGDVDGAATLAAKAKVLLGELNK
jgi:predicted component of type VI protein secretion system